MYRALCIISCDRLYRYVDLCGIVRVSDVSLPKKIKKTNSNKTERSKLDLGTQGPLVGRSLNTWSCFCNSIQHRQSCCCCHTYTLGRFFCQQVVASSPTALNPLDSLPEPRQRSLKAPISALREKTEFPPPYCLQTYVIV